MLRGDITATEACRSISPAGSPHRACFSSPEFGTSSSRSLCTVGFGGVLSHQSLPLSDVLRHRTHATRKHNTDTYGYISAKGGSIRHDKAGANVDEQFRKWRACGCCQSRSYVGLALFSRESRFPVYRLLNPIKIFEDIAIDSTETSNTRRFHRRGTRGNVYSEIGLEASVSSSFAPVGRPAEPRAGF